MVPLSRGRATAPTQLFFRYLTVLVVVAALAGCVGTPPTHRADATATATPTMTQSPQKSHPDLESQLYQLTTADDPQAYARAHNITLRNGSVKVLIELKDGREVPEGYGVDIETSHESRIVAWVPTDQLLPLADHQNVSFVRQSIQPQTFNNT